MLLHLLTEILIAIEDFAIEEAIEKLKQWDVEATESQVDDVVREKLVELLERLVKSRKIACL